MKLPHSYFSFCYMPLSHSRLLAINLTDSQFQAMKEVRCWIPAKTEIVKFLKTSGTEAFVPKMWKTPEWLATIADHTVCVTVRRT